MVSWNKLNTWLLHISICWGKHFNRQGNTSSTSIRKIESYTSGKGQYYNINWLLKNHCLCIIIVTCSVAVKHTTLTAAGCSARASGSTSWVSSSDRFKSTSSRYFFLFVLRAERRFWKQKYQIITLITPQLNCLKCLNGRSINLQLKWIIAENTFDIVELCCLFLLTWIESSSISSVSPTACLSSGSDSDESWRFLFFFFKNVAGGLKNKYIYKNSQVGSFQFPKTKISI